MVISGSPNQSAGGFWGGEEHPRRETAFHLDPAKGALPLGRNAIPFAAIPLSMFGSPGELWVRAELRGWPWSEHAPGDGGAVVGPAVPWSAGGARAPEPPHGAWPRPLGSGRGLALAPVGPVRATGYVNRPHGCSLFVHPRNGYKSPDWAIAPARTHSGGSAG